MLELQCQKEAQETRRDIRTQIKFLDTPLYQFEKLMLRQSVHVAQQGDNNTQPFIAEGQDDDKGGTKPAAQTLLQTVTWILYCTE